MRSSAMSARLKSSPASVAAIVSLLENGRMSKFFEELTKELGFYLMVLSAEDREVENAHLIVADDESILHAIRDRDSEAAVRQLRSHLHSNSQRLQEILAARLATE